MRVCRSCGKIKHRGYMMVSVPNHPRVGNTKLKYVFEHVLVMEEMLGRYLTTEERVHHKNVVKTDNRPQNLELWTTNHPIGCRVEDLVEWAKEILSMYG
jgi:hypothetical protein